MMTPDYSVIGRRIKTLRLEYKMTQEQLADILDLSVAYLSRVERGCSSINLKRLTQIAEVFNTSPGYLLTGSNMNSKEYLRKDFTEILNQCSPQQQKLIYEILVLISKVEIEDCSRIS